MARDLVIIGAGGLGRSIATLVDAINGSQPTPVWNLVGFLDDNPRNRDIENIERRGDRLLGSVRKAGAALAGTAYVVGIGSGAVRENLAQIADAYGMEAVSLVHPDARLGANTTYGNGTMICSGAAIDPDVAVGRHVLINKNSVTGHDCVLGDFVSIGPLAVVGGGSVIGKRSSFGMHAMTIPGIALGDDVTVGAAACVTRDMPDGVTLKGIPAR